MQPDKEGPVAVTDATFAKTVLEAPQPVLVGLGTEWCGPCAAVAPVIRRLALEYVNRLTVATVDVDADPQLAARYGEWSLPSVMLVSSGEIRPVLVGARSGQEYGAAVEGELH